ncbi:oligosaccharide flippase family protein [Stieleria sp. TO1_6]|uniref:lipopolysaccharide biosynthesis protein n=1 Tax=Stieleria tagensis TaxID=2956795 RepID=UPI00209BA60D|nr:oligosaccharide flippase family protein [Stieleria tagensis]MCO8122491.1 oligosaccharide flippase family protein [Stieleria tagensis]
MSIVSRVCKNVASSWVGLGVQIVVTLLLTPVVLANLGLEAYGLWLLLQGLVGYYGLVDMGLRAGVTQSITHRIATNDYRGVRRHIAAARPILWKLSAAVLALSVVASLVLPRLIDTAPDLQSAFFLIVIIQGFGVAVQLPLMPYAAVLVGLQRYDLANGIAVCIKIVYAMLAYITLLLGGGIVALSAILAFTNLLDNLCRVRLAYRLVPELRGSVDGDLSGEVSELFQFGIWNFLIQIGRRLIYYSDTLVVGTLFSAAAIAPFGIAGSLVEYCNSLVKASTRVLYPTMASLHLNGERRQQLALYLFSTRICLIVSAAFLIIGYSHLRAFLLLWLSGPQDITPVIEHSPPLFLLIGIAFAFVSLRRPGTQLLLAAKKLKELATVQFTEAIINLILSLGLGWWIGVEGVALGTLIPAVGLGVIWHLGAHADVLETTRFRILASIVPGTTLYCVALLGTAWGLGHAFGRIDSWFALFGSATVYTLTATLLLPLGFESKERKSAWSALMRRFNSSKKASVPAAAMDSNAGAGSES